MMFVEVHYVVKENRNKQKLTFILALINPYELIVTFISRDQFLCKL